MAQPQVTSAAFERIVERPSVERMVSELDWSGFEHFVAYVLERAGFAVEHAGLQFGQGVDLKLYTGGEAHGRPAAYVSVKHYNPAAKRVGQPEVSTFEGALAAHNNASGYLITTSNFAPPALEMAAKLPRLHLLCGAQLVRYITYLRGSRHRNLHAAPIGPEWLARAEAISRRSPQRTRYLAIANNKGGVGKTTTALNLAFGLTRAGKRVLLVDMDAQANLSQAVPYHDGEGAGAWTLADYFVGACELQQTIRPTQFPHLWIIPAHRDLQLTDVGQYAGPGAELQWVAHIHSLEIVPPRFQASDGFEWVIFDTPPAMSYHTRAALAAAHDVLAPAVPCTFADSGVTQVLHTGDAMRALMGGGVRMLGCVLTQWQDHAVRRDALATLEDELGKRALHLFHARIRFDQNIEKAHQISGSGKGKNIFDLARRPGLGAQDYGKLLAEVLQEVEA